MYESIILPLAKKDIKEAAYWYEECQSGLGLRFTKQVREKVLFLVKTPKAYRIRYDNVRTAVISTFPFMIHYIFEEDTKTVIILAVLHTSRATEIWKKR